MLDNLEFSLLLFTKDKPILRSWTLHTPPLTTTVLQLPQFTPTGSDTTDPDRQSCSCSRNNLSTPQWAGGSYSSYVTKTSWDLGRSAGMISKNWMDNKTRSPRFLTYCTVGSFFQWVNSACTSCMNEMNLHKTSEIISASRAALPLLINVI